MGHFLSTMAGVPLGDVLVNDVQAVSISGHYCLTASIRVTGVDGMCHFTHVYCVCMCVCVCACVCVCVCMDGTCVCTCHRTTCTVYIVLVQGDDKL